jgi:hypothetical protein
MIFFEAIGNLPAPWEDFISHSDNCQNVTITGNKEREDINFPRDGWIDVYIKDDVVTRERATEILSFLFDDVVAITYKGLCNISNKGLAMIRLRYCC